VTGREGRGKEQTGIHTRKIGLGRKREKVQIMLQPQFRPLQKGRGTFSIARMDEPMHRRIRFASEP